MRSSMTVMFWICWTSLVARVMSDAAENFCTSASENAMTRRYSLPRSSRPTPAPTREARSPMTEASTALASTNPIMVRPVRSR
jgi:hypothetical protein